MWLGSRSLAAVVFTLSLAGQLHCAGSQAAHVLRLQRRDGGLLARGLLKNATLPLHGAVKDYGYFYATLQLGSPARSFAVIVDTGSTITYVPCASCGSSCGPHHKDAAFDPSASSTAATVPCGSPHCICGRPACGCSNQQECTYSRTYAEQSSSEGVLIQDLLMVDKQGVGVVFGCETRETGEIYNQEADGILGLGNSEVSLVNQLVASGNIANVFSLCFGSVEGDGALLLGDVPHNVAMQHTPLLASDAHPHYYLVRLEGISVSDSQLDVPQSSYDQGYGTVLDSGTTFTYLPSDAFTAFRSTVSEFALAHGLHSTKGPDPNFKDTCFGGAASVDQLDKLAAVFPQMQLKFAGGTVLTLAPLNYLFMHTGEPGAYCLGVFNNGNAGTLLGGITFRNILVQYDRANARVGFGPAQCQQLGLADLPLCPENMSAAQRAKLSADQACRPRIPASTSGASVEAAAAAALAGSPPPPETSSSAAAVAAAAVATGARPGTKDGVLRADKRNAPPRYQAILALSAGLLLVCGVGVYLVASRTVFFEDLVERLGLSKYQRMQDTADKTQPSGQIIDLESRGSALGQQPERKAGPKGVYSSRDSVASVDSTGDVGLRGRTSSPKIVIADNP